jgi:DNA-binding transcriptional MerR regulator
LTGGTDIVEAYAIAALERETGVSRSTIHFYVRQGLLPSPQKTHAGRSLYGHDHVALLAKIGELKRAGRSLAEIRTTLSPELEKAKVNGKDLARLESDRVRSAILSVATEAFATNGYEKTHVATIIKKLGITHQVFYSHFASKLELLVESFRAFITWNVAYNETRLAETTDLGERVLWRLFADYRASQLASEVMSHIRAERGHSAAERRRLAERAWEGVVDVIERELEALGGPRDIPPVPLELLSYSMIGAHHNAAMRASWDDEWTREDVLRTHLWLWLAVALAMNGGVDSQLARYEGLIRELASREPETPPPPEQ